jgi:Uma2 family endonuclease
MVTYQSTLGPEFDLLPDDTEEALLGSPRHQLVIVTLFNSLTRQQRRRGLSWFVGNQLGLLIPRRSGRPRYRPSPDILVHTTLGAFTETSLDLRRFGPPALAAEIASPSTAREHDLDTLAPNAKPGVYAAAGIAEYLVYDPVGEIIPERVRAWHLGEEGHYVPWLPDERGHWVSLALGVSFAPLGLLLRVYDAVGQLIPNNEEMDDIVAELQAELRRLRGE